MFALVTGATGFLGTHLVKCLVAAGHRVRGLARNPDKAPNLEALGAEVVHGDITSVAALDAATRDIEIVFHAAAHVNNWGPWSAFLATTVGGTQNLLAAALKARVRRFVHISTIRVYDDAYCRRCRVVAEDAPRGTHGFRSFGYYARAKVMAEEAVWRAAWRLPVSVIRPAWIYGPGDELILPSIVRFLRDPAARWPGVVDPCADPIYVTDVAECAIAAAEHPAAIGQAYNAAPHRRTTVREFLGALCRALGIALPSRTAPRWLASLLAHLSEWWAWSTRRASAPRINRAGIAILSEDVRHTPSKAERDLGWRSRVDLTEGIAPTAVWLRERLPEFFPVPEATPLLSANPL